MLAVDINQNSEKMDGVNFEKMAAKWLVLIAAEKDKSAFEGLYNAYAPKLKKYLVRRGSESAVADELTQEVMIKIWKSAKQFDQSRSSPSAWIYVIARNVHIDRVRKKRVHEVSIDFEVNGKGGQSESGDLLSDHVDGAVLRSRIGKLPQEQQDVLRLAFFQGLSHQEVCEELSLPLGTVKSRLRLAFKKLRSSLGDQS